MHLKLVSRMNVSENNSLVISLSQCRSFWSFRSVFSRQTERYTKTRHYLHVLYLFNLSLKTPNSVRSGKNIELFWNIKSACRSKQSIMDLVTLCGIIHVYMHVLCLVAPSADQFFFLACLSHSKIWIFANLCQLYG